MSGLQNGSRIEPWIGLARSALFWPCSRRDMGQETADRRAQHREWLESFGFSPEDWGHIKAHAEEVRDLYTPAALCDLSVPIRVGACLPDEVSRFSGHFLGSCRGRALLYWPMTGREREAWARLRRKSSRRP